MPKAVENERRGFKRDTVLSLVTSFFSGSHSNLTRTNYKEFPLSQRALRLPLNFRYVALIRFAKIGIN